MKSYLQPFSRKLTLFTAVITAFLTISPLIAADSASTNDGKAGRRGRRFRYDTSKEKSYSGTVKSAELKTRGRCRNRTRLLVTATVDGKELRFSAGPKGWLAGKGITLQSGTKFEAKGVIFQGRRGTYLLVREITVNGKTVELRNKDGRPVYRKQLRDGSGRGNGKNSGGRNGNGDDDDDNFSDDDSNNGSGRYSDNGDDDDGDEDY